MQKAYFELRNKEGKLAGNIVLMARGSWTTFGLTLKSKQDKYRWDVGMALAEHRAKEVMKIDSVEDHDMYIFRDEALENMQNLRPVDFKRIMKLWRYTLYGWPSKADQLAIPFKEVVKLFCK